MGRIGCLEIGLLWYFIFYREFGSSGMLGIFVVVGL